MERIWQGPGRHLPADCAASARACSTADKIATSAACVGSPALAVRIEERFRTADTASLPEAFSVSATVDEMPVSVWRSDGGEGWAPAGRLLLLPVLPVFEVEGRLPHFTLAVVGLLLTRSQAGLEGAWKVSGVASRPVRTELQCEQGVADGMAAGAKRPTSTRTTSYTILK